ncbi:MAG: hypothetical protein EPO20_16075 [Betaproteobacteria bacterium]|nr:MAG: hypothetical protein EPO20_16075 [Betaproteobacteria bacterium]
MRAISPQTEADEAALVMQVLVSFGVLVGRGPHIRVESDRHCGNLFALIVGDTAKARKGTSWGRIKDIFARIRSANVLASWPPVVEGLSSGEGLKWAVRDPSATPAKKGGQSVVDPGVVDKRLLVVESEFAQVLRQCARAGNTLSAIIRVAWDGGKLQTLTKNDPITATGAHIAIIGHITAAELRAELTQTDTANGFANRFILMCAKRSKMLPFGGDQMDEAVMSHFAARLGKAAGKAMSLGPVSMADDARQLWGAVYPELSQGHPGLFGAVTARAEAQCLRLALSYALLDELTVIKAEHVKAALAVWKRAEASARHLFGQALGDSVADAIRGALRQAGAGGMTRTQISALFLRHHNAERIQAALNLLQSRGLARFEKQLTAGAPKEIWLCA